MNEAQKEAIRQANAYLSNAGLETYSDVTGIKVESVDRYEGEDPGAWAGDDIWEHNRDQ